MPAGITIDDDIRTPVVADDADRPRGCRWDESVCTASPEYRVVRAAHGHDDAHADPYCPRHYALELARLVEVHLDECGQPASKHMIAYGRI